MQPSSSSSINVWLTELDNLYTDDSIEGECTAHWYISGQITDGSNINNYSGNYYHIGSQTFTKAIYNEAVLALNDMSSGESLLEEATSDNVVNAFAASAYLTLSDKLNSLINNL